METNLFPISKLFITLMNEEKRLTFTSYILMYLEYMQVSYHYNNIMFCEKDNQNSDFFFTQNVISI